MAVAFIFTLVATTNLKTSLLCMFHLWHYSPTKINLHGISGSTLFRNHLKVYISPLKSTLLTNSRSKYRRSVMYPSISKCKAKRCSCCKHLCCKSTINSNVNGRQFSIVTNSYLDWRSTDVIYVLSWEENGCGMQYVEQTIRFLTTRFTEHYCHMKRPHKINNSFYRHLNSLFSWSYFYLAGEKDFIWW